MDYPQKLIELMMQKEPAAMIANGFCGQELIYREGQRNFATKEMLAAVCSPSICGTLVPVGPLFQFSVISNRLCFWQSPRLWGIKFK